MIYRNSNQRLYDERWKSCVGPGCVFGIVSTAISIGSGFFAAYSAGWFACASTTRSAIENICLDVFSKRFKDAYQDIHEIVTREVLSRSLGTPEFVGYVFDGYLFSRLDDEHLHPLAPIFRINYPKHGLVDIASRQHVNSTRLTVTYANHGLQKRQSFQHERLSDHLLEGRFDEGVGEADPSDPSFDAAGGYQQVEDAISCYAKGEWQASSVLATQMYDGNAKATFGFSSIGILENKDADSTLQDLLLVANRCRNWFVRIYKGLLVYPFIEVDGDEIDKLMLVDVDHIRDL